MGSGGLRLAPPQSPRITPLPRQKGQTSDCDWSPIRFGRPGKRFSIGYETKAGEQDPQQSCISQIDHQLLLAWIEICGLDVHSHVTKKGGQLRFKVEDHAAYGTAHFVAH